MKFADIPGECPVPAYQNVIEFGHLWEFLEAREPRHLLEIGSLFGGTLWYWSFLPTLEQLVTIDIPSDWEAVAAGVRAARPSWSEWMGAVDFHDIEGDSHDPALVDRVRAILDGDLLDVAFIDGDHSETGVRQDFDLWAPLVTPGGVVAFHDTIPNGNRHEPGVAKFTRELQWRYPSIEFFDPDGVGICVFVV